jgi:predicted nucleotidyltransferase
MLDLDKVTPLIIEFFKSDQSILLAYLFGSYHDGYANQKSDLDLAVLFKEDISLWNEMALQARLAEIIKFDKVDLINLNKAPLRMQFNILANGRLIYETNKDTTDITWRRSLIYIMTGKYGIRIFIKSLTNPCRRII